MRPRRSLRARGDAAVSAARETVAWACRILAYYGHGDLTLGHASIRAGDRVYMKRKGVGLEEVTPADVLTLDLDGRKRDGDGAVHLEVPLHTEVYKVRPDVGAVIHTHPLWSVALGTVETPLRYLAHDALLFPDGLGVFEETSDLITNVATGGAVAQALGSRRAVLMRNHGVLIVGPTVGWAVLAALALERAAHLQSMAGSLGTPAAIPDGGVPALHVSKYRQEFIDEYWEYWLRCLRRAGLTDGMPARRRERRSRGG
jgi:L-fuculose-phosphate aldolase